jgi:hypothetical protein
MKLLLSRLLAYVVGKAVADVVQRRSLFSMHFVTVECHSYYLNEIPRLFGAEGVHRWVSSIIIRFIFKRPTLLVIPGIDFAFLLKNISRCYLVPATVAVGLAVGIVFGIEFSATMLGNFQKKEKKPVFACKILIEHKTLYYRAPHRGSVLLLHIL